MNITKFQPEAVGPNMLKRIANGESLASDLRDPGRPSYPLTEIHLRSDSALREAYYQVVQDHAAFLSEELIGLADEPIPDGLDPDGPLVLVQTNWARLDTRKLIASRVYRQVSGVALVSVLPMGRASMLAALEAANKRVLAID